MTKSILTKKQEAAKVFHFSDNEKPHTLFVNIRYDDSYNNGHNTFSITGSLYEGTKDKRPYSDNRLVACGCIHDEIIKHAPEFAPFIKWHLFSSYGPMHYIASTLYHASNLDCWGREKGQPYRFERKLKVNDSPFLYTPKKSLLAFIDEVGLFANWADFELIELHHTSNGHTYTPKISFSLMPVTEWHEAPFDSWDEAHRFIHAVTKCKAELVEVATAYGEGKERDFSAARASAVWPEATDEQLLLPKEELTALLKARLPALINSFREDVERLGFVF